MCDQATSGGRATPTTAPAEFPQPRAGTGLETHGPCGTDHARDIRARDLGAVRKIEEWRDEALAFLEILVRERTLDLIRAQQAAEALARAKAEFLATISHEIRSPLAAVLGFAEVLLASDSTPAERTAAGTALRRNGKHLMQVINDILDISRIEAGKMTFSLGPCSPWHMLDAVSATFRLQAEAKGVALRTSCADPIPISILSDTQRLRQILINFLSNALKFTAPGGTIEISLSGRPATGTICFAIRDDGVGMPAELVARLFNPFEQADAATTNRFGGTGLGLSIAKALAEGLGGAIEVESDPGRGSTFRLVLPVPADAPWGSPDEAGTMLREDVEPPTDDQPRLMGRVLLVEDSLDLQRLMTLWLRKAGLDVTVVGDGLAGVGAALAHPFDAILMDIDMPVMDGNTATSTLRRAGYAGVIIGLSARALLDEQHASLAMGMDAYLPKPVDLRTLLATLRKHLPPDER